MERTARGAGGLVFCSAGVIRRMDNDLDIGLLKSRFVELNALCDELEKLIKKPGQSKTELQVLLVKLKNELRLVEVAIPGHRLEPVLRKLRITPQELYILIFHNKVPISQQGSKR